MIRDQPWKPSTLRQVGGAEGVGVTFLEDAFNGRGANPKHRLHQMAGRSVLASLLPKHGGVIKGGMRSYDDLMQAAGYEQRPRDFDVLLQILDSELRLITPTEAVQNAEADSDPRAAGEPPDHQRGYHLTHDYLVGPIAEWVFTESEGDQAGTSGTVAGRTSEELAGSTIEPHSAFAV